MGGQKPSCPYNTTGLSSVLTCTPRPPGSPSTRPDFQIRDGWNGYLVSTVQETADRILHLLRHPEKAAEMGRRGREFVREYYLLPRGVQDHLTVVDQLVNGRITARDSVICYHPQVVTTRMATGTAQY